MVTANTILNTATAEIGYSRWDDPKPGTKYGRAYAVKHGCRLWVKTACRFAHCSLPGFSTKQA
ncbi:hypothetical protein [Mobiluncus curtisii]|uniref:Uncharacterized protein n=1 Tax=Mobiluncus curtisii TaxID=2051 RepID=A0A2X3BR90_9ACTO|nr:hypothetical protein [Mobiluncus curtisii]SQC02304.1 Uncharacterised protein [Mobiluncus curtisii]